MREKKRSIGAIAAWAVFGLALLLVVLALALFLAPKEYLDSRGNWEMSSESSIRPEPENVPHERDLESYWNVWADRWSGINYPSFAPVEHLALESRYLVSVDLSALSYRLDGIAAVSLPAAADFEVLLGQLAGTPLPQYALDVVLLTDPRYFTTPARVLEFPIDVAAMRKYALADQREDPLDLMTALRDGDEARH